MADITLLAQIGSALPRNIDISSGTLVMLSVKVGGSGPNTELTKTILDRLVSLENGSDVDATYHTHNALYYLKTQLGSVTPGSAGSTLIGDNSSYSFFMPTAATLKGALTGIDSALGNVTAVSALDNIFRIKNSADNTKHIAFDANALSPGQTRTMFMPDADVSLGQVNSSIQQDGSRSFLANQPMGGFKLTGLAAGSGAGDSVRYEQAILTNGANPFTASQDMGGFKLTGLASGSANTDAVNYGQLTSLSLGLIWQGPIDDPDLVDDSLSTPPGSPSFSLLYIIAAAPTGAWTGLAGHGVWWDGSQWIDLSTGNLATAGLGTAVQVGARFLVASATNGASGHVGGTFAGGTHNGQVATVTTNTPGSFTYSFATPLNNWAVSDLFAGSQHANNSFVYATSAPFVFTVTAANATAGATYTNNGFVFTVTSTIVGGTQLLANGTGFPATSGTLTKTGGTGDATITFSSFTGSTWINFAGPSKNAAGSALAYNGNTLNVLFDSTSIDTNGSNQLEVKAHGVSNAKLAQMPANTLKGNNTGGTADAADLTISQINALLAYVTTVGSFDSQSKSANGAVISSNSIFFQSADASFPGMVTTGTQTFAGKKTFSIVDVTNLVTSIASTATTGGTTTLVAGSAGVQQFTGSSNQTVVLPDATTLDVGQEFVILNRSTGSLTINKNGGTNVTTITAGNWGIFRVTNISTAAGVWDNGNNLQYSSVYDQRVTVVTSGAVGNQINGPVSPGTNVTLPSSQTYNSSELQIYLNGQRLEVTSDWNTVGSVPRTQVTFVDTLQVGDTIDFVIERNF